MHKRVSTLFFFLPVRSNLRPKQSSSFLVFRALLVPLPTPFSFYRAWNLFHNPCPLFSLAGPISGRAADPPFFSPLSYRRNLNREDVVLRGCSCFPSSCRLLLDISRPLVRSTSSLPFLVHLSHPISGLWGSFTYSPPPFFFPRRFVRFSNLLFTIAGNPLLPYLTHPYRLIDTRTFPEGMTPRFSFFCQEAARFSGESSSPDWDHLLPACSPHPFL